MKTLGEKIKFLRGNLSLKEFADKLSSNQVKFTKGNISKYENNIIKPSYNFFYLIRKKLKVNLNWLVNGDEDPFRT